MMLKTRRFGLCAAVLVASLVSGLPAGAAEGQDPQFLETQALMIRLQSGRQVAFEAELADEPLEQRKGLMYRTSLEDNAGMIFTHDKPRRIGMWMKNTLIPLDMVFMDRSGRVLNVHHDAVPGSLRSIRSDGRSAAVLEIRGGRAQELGIRRGDQVFHCHFGNFPCTTTPPPGDRAGASGQNADG